MENSNSYENFCTTGDGILKLEISRNSLGSQATDRNASELLYSIFTFLPNVVVLFCMPPL